MRFLDTIRGRVALFLVLSLSVAQIFSLWTYAHNSNYATNLLHDVLLAERLASVVRVAEGTPASGRGEVLATLASPTMQVALREIPSLGDRPPDNERAHAFEHLLGILLGRQTHDGIRIAYRPIDAATRQDSLLATVQGSIHEDAHHLLRTPLADIRSQFGINVDVELRDGAWIAFSNLALTVTPFSAWKLVWPLMAVFLSVLFVTIWILQRWGRSLAQFAAAAERFGVDIHAPPLPEQGPVEIRAGARALNVMQERIRRLVEDRTAFAAAIAHDLGTPITRLHLRAHEIHEPAIRSRMLSDLHQMQRMIAATMEFTRLDFIAENVETFDLASLLQSIAHDFSDAGERVSVHSAVPVVIRSRMTTLRRALTNLLDNAVKYGGAARIGVRQTSGATMIVIDDDGPGIPEALFEEAFRPFRRLGDHAQNGSGLGLNSARRVINELGGEVILTNRSEGGLRVEVVLPAQVAEATKTSAKEW